MVAVSLPNASDVVITFHAVARLGAIWLGINRNLAPAEKRFILGDAKARLLLASADVADGLAPNRHGKLDATDHRGRRWRRFLAGHGRQQPGQLPPADPASHGSGRDRLHQWHYRPA